ncbi:MAG: SagB/ThcOx family dehydrogenase [Candidatus Binataceae bacterium]
MGNRDIEAARAFHEITAHSYTSVRSGGHRLDWDNRPLPYKIYPEAGALNLPRDLTLPVMPTLTALTAPDTPPSGSIDLGALTRMLFCADGLTRRKRVGGEDYHFRAAASAGALYPIELYVAAGDIDGVEPGLYHFSPADLKLRGLRRGDWRELIARASAAAAPIMEARAVLIMSAIFWRSAWKYGARAYRYCFWDAGTILANLIAAARAEGVAAEIITTFADSEIELLLGVDGEREGIVCMVPLGRTVPAHDATPVLRPLSLETIPLSSRETAYGELVKLHRESCLDADEIVGVAARIETMPPTPADEGFTPAPLPADQGLGLGDTILRRGSTRIFARAAIEAVELATFMAPLAYPPRSDFPPLTDTYLIVNAAEGMPSGAYYYRRQSGAFELIKHGDFRAQAGYLCLEQALGADCAALICYMTDLERTLAALGNRGYRDAHLEAGMLGGRVYLAAYALGRGASGLTFYDEDATAFFSPHAAGKSPLLMVAVGVPWTSHESEE